MLLTKLFYIFENSLKCSKHHYQWKSKFFKIKMILKKIYFTNSGLFTKNETQRKIICRMCFLSLFFMSMHAYFLSIPAWVDFFITNLFYLFVQDFFWENQTFRKSLRPLLKSAYSFWITLVTLSNGPAFGSFLDRFFPIFF